MGYYYNSLNSANQPIRVIVQPSEIDHLKRLGKRIHSDDREKRADELAKERQYINDTISGDNNWFNELTGEAQKRRNKKIEEFNKRQDAVNREIEADNRDRAEIYERHKQEQNEKNKKRVEENKKKYDIIRAEQAEQQRLQEIDRLRTEDILNTIKKANDEKFKLQMKENLETENKMKQISNLNPEINNNPVNFVSRNSNSIEGRVTAASPEEIQNLYLNNQSIVEPNNSQQQNLDFKNKMEETPSIVGRSRISQDLINAEKEAKKKLETVTVGGIVYNKSEFMKYTNEKLAANTIHVLNSQQIGRELPSGLRNGVKVLGKVGKLIGDLGNPYHLPTFEDVIEKPKEIYGPY